MPHEAGHLTQEEYINQALAAGIPMEAINTFLQQNPGDAHRIISAKMGPREQLQGRGLTNAEIYALTGAGTPIPGVQIIPTSPYLDPQVRAAIANQATRDVISTQKVGGAGGDFMYQTGGFGDVVGDIFRDVLPDIVENLTGRLPLPGGGARPPQLPGSTPPVITIPSGGGGAAAGRIAGALGRFARLPAAKQAAIAAAAAALGMTVEQYLNLYPDAGRSSRRLNPLNPRALRRSLRRLDGFEKFVRRTYRVPSGAQFRGKKYKRRGKRS